MIAPKIAEKYNTILSKKKRTEIRDRMLRTFEVSQSTVRNWLQGRNKPPQYYWSTIAKIMGMSVSELFPDTDNKADVTTNAQAK